MLIAEDLRKSFRATPALTGFSLTVAAGRVCALLGPNGAGKTTAVRVLATLTRPDAGSGSVAGVPLSDVKAVRERIAIVGQEATVDEILTGRENLVMWSKLHHLPDPRARATELLAAFGLTGAADRRVKTYSGGMRRRLDLAAALVTRPAVLFLDEPTTGLDPRARAETWRAVREVAAAGTTVLLTTQYLEEADRLADRVAVLDHGRVVAEDTPAALKARLGGDRVELVVGEEDFAGAAALIGGEGDPETGRLTVPGGVAELVAVLRRLDDAGVTPRDVALRRPTLDEVFLSLTGGPR
ncbi:daunorubicin resistance protein DrrA family ABC transporter ATP-binding protein [Actinorhabdospora filicis]|uniref:Daunorubicin resistance protein DrrA family ABC transporter ATP-binding protein n=1 Tax=Actinorhabdospora filicis TaxID=1785913 RepID=A0A9W6W7X8_9ACTN|nr:ATP-binding cassette domain-containing protein [Actinorhabdospora filicis]GLZ77014.1 daunorubicin resistance protein DrrA family ABC transporter ATP-binding protein [Actinorhabdospora filicis]